MTKATTYEATGCGTSEVLTKDGGGKAGDDGSSQWGTAKAPRPHCDDLPKITSGPRVTFYIIQHMQ